MEYSGDPPSPSPPPLPLPLQCPIVERLTNSLMMHGRNNGKKMLSLRIVRQAFEIIHLLTGEVCEQQHTPSM